MMIVSLAAVIVAVSVVVLVAVAIPAVLEVRKTAATVRETVTRLEGELQPAIKDLRQSLTEVRTLSEAAAARVDDLQCFMSAVGETGRGLRAISSAVGGVGDLVGRSSLWLTGAKVAGKFLLEKFAKKRR